MEKKSDIFVLDFREKLKSCLRIWTASGKRYNKIEVKFNKEK